MKAAAVISYIFSTLNYTRDGLVEPLKLSQEELELHFKTNLHDLETVRPGYEHPEDPQASLKNSTAGFVYNMSGYARKPQLAELDTEMGYIFHNYSTELAFFRSLSNPVLNTVGALLAGSIHTDETFYIDPLTLIRYVSRPQGPNSPHMVKPEKLEATIQLLPIEILQQNLRCQKKTDKNS